MACLEYPHPNTADLEVLNEVSWMLDVPFDESLSDVPLAVGEVIIKG
jgi:hypothetical protein